MTRATVGRLLLTLVAVQLAVGALFFDFNASHQFNPLWPAHARFHCAMTIFLGEMLAVLALAYTWRRAGDERTNLGVAAWMASLYFLSFFPSGLVPGAGYSEPGNEVPLAFGLLPPQVIEGGLSVVLAFVGRWLALPRATGGDAAAAAKAA